MWSKDRIEKVFCQNNLSPGKCRDDITCNIEKMMYCRSILVENVFCRNGISLQFAKILGRKRLSPLVFPRLLIGISMEKAEITSE